MKAVVLTAGMATRLRPVTFAMGKVLIPIYNKPMIFYPISMLIESGITDILIVCNDFDIPFFKKMFENRYSKYGVNIQFTVQKEALGTAHAFKEGKHFCHGEDVILVFGDNIFLTKDLPTLIKTAKENLTGVTIFAKPVNDPHRFGVIETDSNNNILSIEEKPINPKSNLAVTGLMLYTSDVFNKISKLKPSNRGEYETTDLNNMYLLENRAKIAVLPTDCKWADTGTHDSLLEASNQVFEFEKENDLIGCPEVSLFKAHLIDLEELKNLVKIYNSDYANKIINTVLKYI